MSGEIRGSSLFDTQPIVYEMVGEMAKELKRIEGTADVTVDQERLAFNLLREQPDAIEEAILRSFGTDLMLQLAGGQIVQHAKAKDEFQLTTPVDRVKEEDNTKKWEGIIARLHHQGE